MDSSASGTPTAADVAADGHATDPWPARSGVSRTELDPVSFLARSASLHPDRTAVVHGELRRTYEELDARVSRLASALRARGLRRRDRVAILSPNTPALLEAHFGVPAAGGVLVAINARLSAPEVRAILEHSGARTLLVDSELAALVADPPAGVDIVRIDDTAAPDDPYEQLLAEGDPAAARGAPRAPHPPPPRGPPRTSGSARRAPGPPPGGRGRRRTSRSRSTTPRAPRARRRASCTRTAARTSTRSARS